MTVKLKVWFVPLPEVFWHQIWWCVFAFWKFWSW